MKRQLSAGVARTDITPPIGIAHANWGAQTHQRAVGIDLPLWATALALSDGDQTVVIVDVDLGGGRNVVEMQAAITELTGLPRSHIRISFVHTHSGPSSNPWITEGAEMFGPYTESLVGRIAGVAWAAVRDLRPARIAAGVGTCGIAVNRRFQRPEDGVVVVGRNWEGPVDHAVHVIRIDDLEGAPLAAVVNYACHPITVGPDNDLITPDYPGVVKRVVEEATGATCLFLQGAAGDVGPGRGVARGGINEYKRLGAILGHEASRVWWEMELPARQERYLETLESGAPLAVYADEPLADPDPTLRVGTRPMHLPLKDLPAPEALEAELEENLARLNELRDAGASDEEIRWQTMLCKRTNMRAATARRLQGQTHQTFELQAFAIGAEIALVAMPGEPFVETGLEVKRNSPFKHTLFSGYSNVGRMYIPTAEAFALGGYEAEWATPFSPDAAGDVADHEKEVFG
jgi:hypothetical protein